MSQTVTKNDIAKIVSEKHQIPKTQAYNIVSDVFTSLIGSVMEGKRIEIRNFGVFSKKVTKPREGRNPQDGTRYDTIGNYQCIGT